MTVPAATSRRSHGSPLAALGTLARRRLSLSASTPREVVVPLLTPILFADVIAPALAKAIPATRGIDYLSFVAVGTIGLLVPLSCVLGGIGMIVDRESGAQRDLLAAPTPRGLMVLANLSVALLVSALQVTALMVAAVLRGASFASTASGIGWAVGATLALAVAMHSIAEILAARIDRQEEYVGVAPPVALLPWFFAGSFFPISALPAGLTGFAKVLPLTHALALLRYGLVDPRGAGLRDIWGMSDPTAMAVLSLGVVVLFAAAMLALAVRVFTRSAVR
ncbi:MAG TPA: ABC transporter permease [Acidimicrobiales bacterium]|nr:ABC transporter permease [Acidimicrobiales bacterium]